MSSINNQSMNNSCPSSSKLHKLTKDELVSMVLEQQEDLCERNTKIKNLEFMKNYIEGRFIKYRDATFIETEKLYEENEKLKGEDPISMKMIEKLNKEYQELEKEKDQELCKKDKKIKELEEECEQIFQSYLIHWAGGRTSDAIDIDFTAEKRFSESRKKRKQEIQDWMDWFES